MDVRVDDGEVDHGFRLAACAALARVIRPGSGNTRAPPRTSADIFASICLTPSSASSVAAILAFGTTTTPSLSPRMRSPDATARPPHTISPPTTPGPRRVGEFGVTPIA